GELSNLFPVTEEQVLRVARTEPTLRDMLQQFRHLFDHLVYGSEDTDRPQPLATERIPAEDPPPAVKSVSVVGAAPVKKEENTEATAQPGSPEYSVRSTPQTVLGPTSNALNLPELWDQEVRAARRKLEPEGALTGATRELQSGLG